MKINLKNDAGMLKTVPVGYNFLIAICGPALTVFYVSLKLGLLMAIIPGSQLIVAGIYNRKQIEKLLMNGFKPADKKAKEILQKKGIIAADE